MPDDPENADLVGKIMRYEADEMDGDETVAFFQELIDSGLVWQLQGSYGRMARTLIAAGHCTPKKEQGGNSNDTA